MKTYTEETTLLAIDDWVMVFPVRADLGNWVGRFIAQVKAITPERYIVWNGKEFTQWERKDMDRIKTI